MIVIIKEKYIHRLVEQPCRELFGALIESEGQSNPITFGTWSAHIILCSEAETSTNTLTTKHIQLHNHNGDDFVKTTEHETLQINLFSDFKVIPI